MGSSIGEIRIWPRSWGLTVAGDQRGSGREATAGARGVFICVVRCQFESLVGEPSNDTELAV